MSLVIAVDTGGTFTDLAAYDSDNGRLVTAKSLTTHGSVVDGVMSCIDLARISLKDADLVKMGTTLVINTFLERKGARAALVTTEGFRDVLDLRRGNRPVPFDLRFRPEPTLIPRDIRFEVRERMAADGSVVVPLDPDGIEKVVDDLRRAEVESVAVALVNAYANPAHEQAVAEALRDALPGVYVTAATDLVREWHEYERTSTAAANAYVGPPMARHVDGLAQRMRSEGLTSPAYLMASNGGAFTLERARRQPVMLVESGPVGGCIGAAAFAARLEIPRAIAFDMGGTTAKCAVVADGEYDVRSPYYVGGPAFGFPIQGAVVDIVEVGAGGGSIAGLDPQGRLHVGPRSAGSSPGPVAYGLGGTEPTITDAHVVLGRFDADSMLGGQMRLNPEAAFTAVRDRIAQPLGYEGPAGVATAARGIVTLGVLTMAGAIREVTVERGLDPRDFALVAFGGGGPLHAGTLARELGMGKAIIPPHAGIFSAFGMLLADARLDEAVTHVAAVDAEGIDSALSLFEETERELAAAMARDLGPARVAFERRLELRYRGQKQALRVPWPSDPTPTTIRSAFEEDYRRQFGHADPDGPLEMVNVLVTGVAALPGPDLSPVPPGKASAAPTHRREVVFDTGDAPVSTPVYRRDALALGAIIEGPAVIEEYGAATLVAPGDRAEIGRLGEINLTVALS